MMKRRHATLLAVLTCGAAIPTIALAQDAGPVGAPQTEASTLDEVVVTATRREQNLQDIPIAISALGSEELDQANISSLADVQGFVPGLQINRNNAALTFTLRGVGTNFRVQGVDTTVAVHTDGVYVGAANPVQAAFFDVARLEVVRGPQGVLYGRNASGGAINIVSNLPTADPSAYLSGSYGNYNAYELEGVISGPVVEDVLLFRAGAYSRGRDGFGTNLTTGEDNDDLNEHGGRATLLWTPTERFSATLRADFYNADDNGMGTEALPGSAPGRPNGCLPTPAACALGLTRAETLGGVISSTPHDTYGNVQSRRTLDVRGGSLELAYDVSDRLTLKSLSAYRDFKSWQQTDQDATRLSVNDPFEQRVEGWQGSEELQATYQADRFFGILGAYYFKETRNGTTFLAFPALDFLPAPNFGDVFQTGKNTTEAFAIFGNIDFDLTESLTLGLGARYSDETKGTVGAKVEIFGPLRPTAVEASWDAFTPRISLTWEPSPDWTVYASASQGFKSGQFALATPLPAEPETLWAYEAGTKGSFMDGRARMTFGGFYYDFENLQLQLFNGPANIITNAPAATAYGLEASLDLLLPAEIAFHVDATWEQSEYEGLITDNPNIGPGVRDLSGFEFAYTPEFSYTASIEKTFFWGDGAEGVLRLEDQYNGDTFLDIYNNPVNGFREAYHIINASYRHTIGQDWTITAWGKNLADEDVIMASNFGAGVIGNTRLVNYNPPRTFGVTVRRDF